MDSRAAPFASGIPIGAAVMAPCVGKRAGCEVSGTTVGSGTEPIVGWEATIGALVCPSVGSTAGPAVSSGEEVVLDIGCGAPTGALVTSPVVGSTAGPAVPADAESVPVVGCGAPAGAFVPASCDG